MNRALPLNVGSWTLKVGCSVLLALIAGCSSNKPAAPSANNTSTQPTTPVTSSAKNSSLNKWLAEVDVDVPPGVYRVEPPDVLRITAPAIKEIDKAEVRVRTDGKITLNLVGEMYVANMAPAEIAEELSKRLEKFYNKETIFVTVDVSLFESKKYYVFGQVFAPGVKAYTGRDTVVKVLAEAGLNDDAWPQKIVLVRPSEDTRVRQKVTIDVKEMYQSGKVTQNYILEEGDLIYVPPSPLAEFRITFDKLLAPIRPVTDLAMMAYGF